ncbi:hypothetical protein U9M48_027781 [Paspalum notatum var. saurae]|uniref:Uncharacterized protein n=1 Tax=Paspalum notatum var. saurae TaxID=547442 RepID=A0AAQ3X0U9_PASNO
MDRARLPSRAQARARAAHSAASRAPRSTPPHSAHSRAPDAPLLAATRPRDAQIPSASTLFTAPSTPPTLFGSPPRRLVRTLPDAEAYPRVSPVFSRTRCAPRRGPGEPELAGARARRRAHARGGRRKNGLGDPANEELPPDQPLIEEPEDEPEDPHATADHTAAEAPTNSSGEGMEFLMCPYIGGGTCVQHD